MSLARSELQLHRDPTRRMVGFLIGAMVYLAALAVTGGLMVGTTINRWSDDLRGNLTVQLPGVTAAGAAEATGRIDTVVSTLLETQGVAGARALPRRELLSLLERWLGRGNIPDDLPIPALIDVTLEPGVRIDLDDLQRRLAREVPGARISDNGIVLDRLVRLAHSVQAAALAIVLLVGLAAVAIITFVTRAGLAMHHETIELLHLIGARNNYIARQFVRHVVGVALVGGILGLLAAAGTILGLARVAADIDVFRWPTISLADPQLVALLTLPLVAAVIAMVTARLTVAGALRRLP
ncbi:MAG: FtsX-like permease family protein [Alphaproteobacteria bacterium]|nr:FtsX-like permease family protein [Alphaproteobacteria bacterium]